VTRNAENVLKFSKPHPWGGVGTFKVEDGKAEISETSKGGRERIGY